MVGHTPGTLSDKNDHNSIQILPGKGKACPMNILQDLVAGTGLIASGVV